MFRVELEISVPSDVRQPLLTLGCILGDLRTELAEAGAVVHRLGIEEADA